MGKKTEEERTKVHCQNGLALLTYELERDNEQQQSHNSGAEPTGTLLPHRDEQARQKEERGEMARMKRRPEKCKHEPRPRLHLERRRSSLPPPRASISSRSRDKLHICPHYPLLEAATAGQRREKRRGQWIAVATSVLRTTFPPFCTAAMPAPVLPPEAFGRGAICTCCAVAAALVSFVLLTRSSALRAAAALTRFLFLLF